MDREKLEGGVWEVFWWLVGAKKWLGGRREGFISILLDIIEHHIRLCRCGFIGSMPTHYIDLFSCVENNCSV